MKKFLLGSAAICCLFSGSLTAKDKLSVGVVNFAKCISDSKYGKEEQANFENIRGQLNKAVEDLEKQFNETQTKLNDPDVLDSLSPEAENELKGKLRTLNEEMQRYQMQYSQILQQANMQIVQKMMNHIHKASDQVAKTEDLELVINKEAAFSFDPELEVTDAVINQMNKDYEQENQTKKGKEK